MRWSMKFCADWTNVTLVEASVSGMERDFDVAVDSKSRGRVLLLRSHAPGVAIGSSGALIWSGVRLYWLEKNAEGASRFDMPEEVIAAFEIQTLQWLVVFELSVGLWHPDRGVSARVDVDDVVSNVTRNANGLFLRDFAGRAYRIELPSVEETLKLQRI